MNRRQLLLGVGSTAAASTLLVGSGAFSQVEADRSMSVRVARDSSGYLGLVPNTRIKGIRESESGELEVDFTGTGLNPSATTQLGHFAETEDERDGFDPRTTEKPISSSEGFTSAFLVVNQSTEDQLVELTIDQSIPEGMTLLFQSHDVDGDEISAAGFSEDGTYEVQTTLDVGDAFGISFVIDTNGADVGDSLAADIMIHSESTE